MRILFTSFILLFFAEAYAQNERIHTSFPLSSTVDQRISEETDFMFTAIALKSASINDLANIAFIHHTDTLFFTNNPHVDSGSEYSYSNLIHFNEPLQAVNLYSDIELNNLEVVLINGSGQYIDFSKNRRMQMNNDCELNNIIDQSEWRSGLPEPTYNRSFTTVENMIVHHSAGSNNISDYTQAVRNIYIFHTEENGWSDIGYNYLVAPDGVVYAGRDPAEGNQDEVLGAHFCGSNSSTMGVCLLGNYETVDPTEEMISSLEEVLSWKAFKDELNVLETNFHPLNDDLGVIAGHRDGCSTLCPGKNVYELLPQIRQNVESQVSMCKGETKPVIDIEFDSILSQKIYPNPVEADYTFSLNMPQDSKDGFRYLRIFDQQGKMVNWNNLYVFDRKVEVELPKTLKPGIYFLQTVFYSGKETSQRFLIQ